MTNEEIFTEIRKLEDKVQELKKSLAPAVLAPEVPLHEINKTLREQRLGIKPKELVKPTPKAKAKK